MNWTGGRLHRHSVSNSNKVLKTQKKHFANARVRSINKWQSLPSAPSLFREALEIGPVAARGYYEEVPETPNLYSGQARWGFLQQPKEQNLNGSHGRQDSDAHLGSTTVIRQPTLNTFEDFQKCLLDRSDWLGLSASKPICLGFSPSRRGRRTEKHRGSGKIENKGFEKPEMRVRPDTKATTKLQDLETNLTWKDVDLATILTPDSSKLGENAPLARPNRSTPTDSYNSLLPSSVYSDVSEYVLLSDGNRFLRNATIDILGKGFCSDLSQPQIDVTNPFMVDTRSQPKLDSLYERLVPHQAFCTANDHHRDFEHAGKQSIHCSAKHIVQTTNTKCGESTADVESGDFHDIMHRTDLTPTEDRSASSLVPRYNNESAPFYTGSRRERSLELTLQTYETDKKSSDKQDTTSDMEDGGSVADMRSYQHHMNAARKINDKNQDSELHDSLLMLGVGDQGSGVNPSMRISNGTYYERYVSPPLKVPFQRLIGSIQRANLLTGSWQTPPVTPNQTTRKPQLSSSHPTKEQYMPQIHSSPAATVLKRNTYMKDDHDRWMQYMFSGGIPAIAQEPQVEPTSVQSIRSSTHRYLPMR